MINSFYLKIRNHFANKSSYITPVTAFLYKYSSAYYNFLFSKRGFIIECSIKFFILINTKPLNRLIVFVFLEIVFLSLNNFILAINDGIVLSQKKENYTDIANSINKKTEKLQFKATFIKEVIESLIDHKKNYIIIKILAKYCSKLDETTFFLISENSKKKILKKNIFLKKGEFKTNRGVEESLKIIDKQITEDLKTLLENLETEGSIGYIFKPKKFYIKLDRIISHDEEFKKKYPKEYYLC